MSSRGTHDLHLMHYARIFRRPQQHAVWNQRMTYDRRWAKRNEERMWSSIMLHRCIESYGRKWVRSDLRHMTNIIPFAWNTFFEASSNRTLCTSLYTEGGAPTSYEELIPRPGAGYLQKHHFVQNSKPVKRTDSEVVWSNFSREFRNVINYHQLYQSVSPIIFHH